MITTKTRIRPVISVTIAPDTASAFNRECRRRGLNKSAVVDMLIAGWLRALDDQGAPVIESIVHDPARDNKS